MDKIRQVRQELVKSTPSIAPVIRSIDDKDLYSLFIACIELSSDPMTESYKAWKKHSRLDDIAVVSRFNTMAVRGAKRYQPRPLTRAERQHAALKGKITRKEKRVAALEAELRMLKSGNGDNDNEKCIDPLRPSILVKGGSK